MDSKPAKELSFPQPAVAQRQTFQVRNGELTTISVGTMPLQNPTIPASLETWRVF